MSEQSTIWIFTTFGFLVTTIISSLVTLSFWLFMKDEGRFFFKRNFDKKGIDVIRHEPGSNRLRLITVKWNGKYFQHKKEMLMFGIETLINPITDSQKYFNEVIGRMCTWADSKRPVLIATDVMSHLIPPDLLALVIKTKKNDQYAQADSFVEKIKKKLTKVNPEEGPEPPDPEIVTYLETMKPNDLSEFMEDISARDAYEVYETGKRVTQLNNQNGFELGGVAKVALSLAGIGLVLFLIYLASTGQLETIIDSVKN